MSLEKPPATQAVRMLREHGVAFTSHPYVYQERGGTEVSARALGVDEHAVIKTLIMEDDAKRPLIVLMHGDREVSTKSLARHLGVKRSSRARQPSPTGIPGTRSVGPVRSARASQCRCTWSGPLPRCRGSTSMAASAVSW